MFTIEHDVPVPAARKSGPKSKYPFRQMRKGDSFLVPVNGVAMNVVQSTLHSTARRVLPKTAKVVTRRTEDGVRVWRVK